MPFCSTLDTLGPCLPGTVFVLNTGIAARGDVQTAFDLTVAAYRSLAERADAHGVRLALEPLNPLAMNEDSFAWNLEDALDLVDAVGARSLGICADMWNLAGQYDLEARLARVRRQDLSRSSVGLSASAIFSGPAPGRRGSIDFGPFLRGLRAAAYDGPLVLEIFSKDVSDSLYDGDLHAVVARSRDALTAMLGEPPRRPVPA